MLHFGLKRGQKDTCPARPWDPAGPRLEPRDVLFCDKITHHEALGPGPGSHGPGQNPSCSSNSNLNNSNLNNSNLNCWDNSVLAWLHGPGLRASWGTYPRLDTCPARLWSQNLAQNRLAVAPSFLVVCDTRWDFGFGHKPNLEIFSAKHLPRQIFPKLILEILSKTAFDGKNHQKLNLAAKICDARVPDSKNSF